MHYLMNNQFHLIEYVLMQVINRNKDIDYAVGQCSVLYIYRKEMRYQAMMNWLLKSQ